MKSFTSFYVAGEILFGIIIGLFFGIGILLFGNFFPVSSSQSPEISQILQILQTPDPIQTVSFLAVGDIMLSRGVDQAIRKQNNPLRPFEPLSELFESVDFSFGNFESPINGTDFAGKNGSLVFNTPVKNLEGLEKYHFEVLNLANNHALDQGEKGLQSTLKILKEKGFMVVGAGNSLDEAWQPKIIEKNGIRIAFIGASYASYNDNGSTRNPFIARIEDTNLLRNAIDTAKKTADFVVVTMHAGTEYVRTPNAAQKTFAHSAIDFGADIVIGAHPHWVQIIETYKEKPIFYSLGNFIFDQEWSAETKQGLVLRIQLSKTSTQKKLLVEKIPVMIENYSTPRKANKEEAEELLQNINN